MKPSATAALLIFVNFITVRRRDSVQTIAAQESAFDKI